MYENRYAQKELFEEFATADKKKRARSKDILTLKSSRTINLSREYLIFIAMAFIICAIISFSLGVEKGKRLTVRSFFTTKTSPQMQPMTQEIEPIEPVPLRDSKAEVKAAEKKPDVKAVVIDAGGLKGAKPAGLLYTVQIASYLKQESADKEIKQLKGKGIEAYVVSSDKYFIVYVGQFKDKNEAWLQQKKLRKLYPDCYVKKVK